MRVIKGIARFLYDFIVGDDWKIAVAVLTAVAVAALLAAAGASATVVAGVATLALMVGFTVAVVLDVRRGSA